MVLTLAVILYTYEDINEAKFLSYIWFRCSLRIRIRAPWSENDRDKKVESRTPGKLLAEYTVNPFVKIDLRLTAPFKVISNNVNLRRNWPSTLTDKSPRTKKPPSKNKMCTRRVRPACHKIGNMYDGSGIFS